MFATSAFLLALPTLFSIVNPFGMAFLIEELVGDLSRADRARVVRRVAIYALAVMLGAIWTGSAILSFFGVSIEALRLAGGLVVSLSALELLLRPAQKEARKQEQADTTRRAMDMAFYPITMPLTTGPGTIAVAIALASARPDSWAPRLQFFAGLSAAAVVMAGLIWVVYLTADRLARLFSPTAQRIVTRLGAFLLLCIGVQIMLTGTLGVASMIAGRVAGGS